LVTRNQLRTFVVLAATSSVHQAAKSLFVTQPAVSAAVASLQQELGVPLVERDGRRLRLTDAGQVLAAYGRRILGLWEEAVVATVATADPERGRLRVAAVTTAGEHLLPAPLGTFRESHADVEIVLEVGNRRGVWDLLRSGEVDLAIGGRPPLGGGFVSLGEAENDLLLVSSPGLFGGKAARASVAELGRRTWLVREEGSGTRATTEELLQELSIAPTLLTLGSNGAVRESALAGLGVALLSRAAVARQLAAGELEELRAGPLLPLRRPWHLVARSDSDLPATSRLFVEHLLAAGVFGRRGAAGSSAFPEKHQRETPASRAASGTRRRPANQRAARRGPQP
jgi:LysR family transcriptional regulator, low CO2-responsive transcriptional regulator